MRYFDHDVEYPRDIAFDPLPWGIMYNYVSSTFLNGFINYVKIEKAFLLDRYGNDEDIFSVQVQAKPFQWVEFKGNRHEIFDRLIQPGATFHCRLDEDFQDDVVIFARIETDSEIAEAPYMVFWYDRDCSDCCIGRFKTTDALVTVLVEFDTFVNETQSRVNKDGKLKEIPLHYFKGWLAG